ncbi:MAG: DNA adenine methylase [Thermodesulfobacteriota bacterium]
MENNKIKLCNNSKLAQDFAEDNGIRPTTVPYLKWAGGKQWLAPFAPLLLPPNFSGVYFEPFLGAGAFFFAVEPAKAVLTDINSELITTYIAIKENLSLVIEALKSYPYNKDFYYYIRSKKPHIPHLLAARIIYLNRTCWNGLYRVNQSGEFNVPFGRFKNPIICDEGRLRSAVKLLNRAKIYCCDFQKAVEVTRRGDFVYFDPPYITGHKDNGFLKYNTRLFSWSDQERLSQVAISLRDRGVWVLISNADHNKVISLYKGFFYYKISRKSLIGGLGSNRGVVTEALLSNYPLFGIHSEGI